MTECVWVCEWQEWNKRLSVCVSHIGIMLTPSLINVYSAIDKQTYYLPLIALTHHATMYKYYIHKNKVMCTIRLYILQTIHLFTELWTMDMQTYPYMEERRSKQSRAEMLEKYYRFQILTIDPYIGRALRRPPLIGGLARIQALVLHCDSINVEGPILWWYHNTWRWWCNLLDTRLQLRFACFLVFFCTWSQRQSSLILVPCDGWSWDAFRGTAEDHWAADVHSTVCQIVHQHRRLQNWK